MAVHPSGWNACCAFHFIQHWFNLADFACEEALYDIASLRQFVGIDLGCEAVPDATTLLKFRHLLEENKLNEKLFAEVGRVLQGSGMSVKTGTIVDATIIAAPSSTKNADKKRDPEMHQTKKGKQWYFGMKLHIGVDSQTGLAHSAVVTAANVHDKHPLPALLHGQERRVYGDSAYASQKELIHSKAPKAKDFTNQRTKKGGEINEAKRLKNRNKSKIRARVEHVFTRDQAPVGFYQGTLSRLGKEHRSRINGTGLGEYLPVATSIDGTGAPVSGRRTGEKPNEQPERAKNSP